MVVESIFAVTEFRTGKQTEEWVLGYGQKAITDLRKKYPRFTKFVLEGFEIDGTFIPLETRTLNRVR